MSVQEDETETEAETETTCSRNDENDKDNELIPIIKEDANGDGDGDGDGDGNMNANGNFISKSFMRGPLVISASLSALLLPLVASHLTALIAYMILNITASPSTLVLCGGIVFGCTLTIMDLHKVLSQHAMISASVSKLKSLMHQIASFIQNDLIIDDVLCNIFAPDGWISFVLGSYVGTVVLYALPLSKELRWRIISHVCDWGQQEGGTGNGNGNGNRNENDNGNDNGIESNEHERMKNNLRQLLFQPGGVWKTMFETNGSKSDREQDHVSELWMQNQNVEAADLDMNLTIAATETETEIATATNPLGTDLEWTSMDDEGANANFVHDNNDRDGGSNELTSNGANHSSSSTTAASTESASPSLSNTSPHPGTTVERDTTEKIAKDVVRHLFLKVWNGGNVNENLMKCSDGDGPSSSLLTYTSRMQIIGILASVGLCVQMRYSHVARRIVYHVAQGSVAVGLSSVAFASFASASCGRKIVDALSTSPSPSPSGDNTSSEKRTTRTNGGSGIRRSRMEENAGGLEVTMQRIMGRFIHRFRNDVQFRRKWQGIFAMMVLCWFRVGGRGRGRGRVGGRGNVNNHGDGYRHGPGRKRRNAGTGLKAKSR